MLRCRVFVYNSSCGYLLDDSWILAIVNFITAAAAAGGADLTTYHTRLPSAADLL